jgi:hypothetical protein
MSAFTSEIDPGCVKTLCCDFINLRLPTYGSVYAWGFEKNGREMKVHVEGRLVFNNLALRLSAVQAGLGLAY